MRTEASAGIFYGWWNVAASFVGLSLSYAMFTVFAFGTFVAPLEAEFGWTRTEISFALTITNITIVFCSPLVGWLVDRVGVRRVVIPSVVLMGVAVASMNRMQGNIWYFYAMYLLIPLLGAGTLPLSYSRVVVAWFRKRRITSILAHLVPMLIGRGVAPSSASLYMGSLGAGLIVGRILAGYLMDRFFAPYVAATFLLLMCFGIAVLALEIDGVLVLVAAIMIGLALGSEISEIAYIVSRYFGSRAFGQINGIMFGAFQLGSAFGAPAMGLYYDRIGNYVGALWVLVGVVFLGVVLISRLGPYPKLPQERPA